MLGALRVQEVVEIRASDTGDFVTTVRLFLEAGERVKPAWLPTGLDEIDALLRAYLTTPGVPG